MLVDSFTKKKINIEKRSLWRKSYNSTAVLDGTLYKRSLLAIVGIFVGFAIVTFRVFEVSLCNDVEVFYSNYSKLLNNSTCEAPVSRANIVDCNGELVAANVVTKSLFVNPTQIQNLKEAVDRLHSALPELSKAELKRRLSKVGQFVWLKRHLTPQQQLKILRLGIPGVYFQRDEKRLYVHSNLVSHVVGVTDVDNNGVAGIEKGCDDDLAWGTLPVSLTIDVRIQHAVRDELSNSIKKFSAKGGAAIVMDIENGNILALVSLPDLNPNLPADVTPEKLFNKATLGLYEAGSTFKVLTLAAALNYGKANLHSQYDATQPLRVAGFNIKDFRAKNRQLNLAEVFVYSSNIGSARMALEMGSELFSGFLRKLNLFDKPSLELPEVARPKVPTSWPEWRVATAAYGYGVQVSLLQLANAVGGIVNNGQFYAASIIKDGRERQGRQVVSAETSAKMRQLFRMAALNVHKQITDVSGYAAGGKSGTALATHGKGYDMSNVRAMYINVFPINKPKYLVAVMLENPVPTKETFGYRTGNWNAGPTTARIIERIATVLNIPKVDTKQIDQGLPKLISADHT